MGVLNPEFVGVAEEAGKADTESHGDKGLDMDWLREPSSRFIGGVLPGSKNEKKL